MQLGIADVRLKVRNDQLLLFLKLRMKNMNREISKFIKLFQ